MSECDVIHRKGLMTGCNKIKSTVTIFCVTDAALLEPEIVSKQRLVQIGPNRSRFYGNHTFQSEESLLEGHTPLLLEKILHEICQTFLKKKKDVGPATTDWPV